MIAYREYQNSTAMDQDLSCYTENLKLTTTVARSSDSNDSFRFVNKSFRLPDRNIETIWIMLWSLMKPWQVWRLSVNKDVHFSAWIMRISFMLFLKLESSDLHSLFFEWKRATSTAFKIYYFVFHIRKKFIQVCTDVRVSKQTQFKFLEKQSLSSFDLYCIGCLKHSACLRSRCGRSSSSKLFRTYPQPNTSLQ